MKNVAVAFRPGREVGETVGSIVAGSDSRKVCLVERAYRGTRPQAGETWVCSLVRDTKPGQRSGANLVRPIKLLTWRLVETDDRIDEMVRVKPHCLEFPDLAQDHVDEATWEACARRNAPYERARAEEQEFQNAPWTELVERFGSPTSVEPIGSSEHSFLVTFPGGRVRRGSAQEVSLCFAPEAFTATGAWEWENSVSKVRILAEYALNPYPLVRVWRCVATSGIRPPHTECRLPEATRAEIVQALREQLGTPEKAVERRSRLLDPPPVVAQIIKDLILLGSPGKEQLSNDGMDGKDERIAVLHKRLEAELFHPPAIMIPDEELRPGITEEEWRDRSNRHFNTLAQAKREEVETTIRAGIATAQAEYNEYQRLAGDISRLRAEVSSVEQRCREAGFRTEWCHYSVTLGRSTLEELRQAHEVMTQWIETASNALAEELRQREERKIAQTKALAEALSVPATPMPWFLDGVRTEDVEQLTGRKEGEGIGTPVEGQRNLFLPGDRALVALRIGGNRKSRHHFSVEVSGLVALPGSSSFPTHIHDHRGGNVLGLVTDNSWSVTVTEFDQEEVVSYALYTTTGIGRLVPAKGWQEESWHTANWNGEIGAGPSLEHMRGVFQLDASKPQDEETLLDREDLAIILRVIGGTDIETVRTIRSFAQAIANVLGHRKGAEMLRAELDATYGHGAKQRVVSEKVPSIADTEAGARFLRLRRAHEVDTWLLGAVTWLESRPEYTTQPTPQPVTTPVAATLANLQARFSKGGKNKR